MTMGGGGGCHLVSPRVMQNSEGINADYHIFSTSLDEGSFHFVLQNSFLNRIKACAPCEACWLVCGEKWFSGVLAALACPVSRDGKSIKDCFPHLSSSLLLLFFSCWRLP